MAISVKKIALWRAEVRNEPGVLASVLQPLAEAGVNLQVMMAYRFPGHETQAAVELYPVTGRRAAAAAGRVGFKKAEIPTLLVEGDNRPGLGAFFSRAIAEAGINMAFVVAQVVGRRYSAVFGFASEADADRAAGILKKAARARR